MRNNYKKIDFDSEDYLRFSISELKRVADFWLRRYLLTFSKKHLGKYFCPLKKKYFSEKNMEVAHFIPRMNLITRYDLDNCHLVSKQSNTWDSKIAVEGYSSLHIKDYSEYLGYDKVKELIEKSSSNKSMQRLDYVDKIKEFKKAIEYGTPLSQAE